MGQGFPLAALAALLQFGADFFFAAAFLHVDHHVPFGVHGSFRGVVCVLWRGGFFEGRQTEFRAQFVGFFDRQGNLIALLRGLRWFGAGLSTSKGGRPKLARSLLVSSTDMEISPFDSSTLNLDLKSCFSLGATREWECLGERDRLGEREL